MESKGHKVLNVSKNAEYYDIDVDFIVTSAATGATKSFEVKWDERINATGNLYLELENIRSKGGKGWFEFCEADYVAYGDANARVFYIIPLEQLKEKANKLPYREGRCGFDSVG
jgi:hypothetical protein